MRVCVCVVCTEAHIIRGDLFHTRVRDPSWLCTLICGKYLKRQCVKYTAWAEKHMHTRPQMEETYVSRARRVQCAVRAHHIQHENEDSMPNCERMSTIQCSGKCVCARKCVQDQHRRNLSLNTHDDFFIVRNNMLWIENNDTEMN